MIFMKETQVRPLKDYLKGERNREAREREAELNTMCRWGRTADKRYPWVGACKKERRGFVESEFAWHWSTDNFMPHYCGEHQRHLYEAVINTNILAWWKGC